VAMGNYKYYPERTRWVSLDAFYSINEKLGGKMHSYLALFLVFICTPCFAAWTEQSRTATDVSVTVDTVTVRVRQLIDDPYSATGAVRYSSSTIYSLINAGHQIMCLQTQALTTSATTTLTAGTTMYDLPSNCVFIDRITIDLLDGLGTRYMSQKTVYGLDLDSARWDVQKSSPTSYYLLNRQIGFYPAPTGSPKIKLWYTKLPATLDSADDHVFDGYTQMEPYWELLAVYAAAKLALVEGNSGLYGALVAEWQGGIKDVGAYLKYNPQYTPTNMMGK